MLDILYFELSFEIEWLSVLTCDKTTNLHENESCPLSDGEFFCRDLRS